MNWQKTSQATLYDHFSHNLEVRDINTSPTSVRYGYGDSYPVASAENTSYTNWCYSGAEDVKASSNYFDGEVEGSSTQFASSTYAHTGNYCSRVATNQEGFKFKIKKSELPMSGYLRASVWVHQNGKNGAYFDCSAFGNASNYIGSLGAVWPSMAYIPVSANNSNAHVEQAGGWYLLNFDINLSHLWNASLFPGADYIEIKLVNNGQTPYVYADDFRVHPISSPIEANVYDKISGKVIATLDEDNYATKYFYDTNGRLKSVQRETKNGFVVVSNSGYNYAK